MLNTDEFTASMTHEVESKWARGKTVFTKEDFFGVTPNANIAFDRMIRTQVLVFIDSGRAVMAKQHSETYRRVKLGGRLV